MKCRIETCFVNYVHYTAPRERLALKSYEVDDVDMEKIVDIVTEDLVEQHSFDNLEELEFAVAFCYDDEMRGGLTIKCSDLDNDLMYNHFWKQLRSIPQLRENQIEGRKRFVERARAEGLKV